jgi:hypothetical protein
MKACQSQEGCSKEEGRNWHIKVMLSVIEIKGSELLVAEVCFSACDNNV